MPCLCDDLSDIESERRQTELHNDIKKLKDEKNNLESALCATLTYIETIDNGSLNDFVIMTDWEESGITSNQVESWWKEHKEKDLLRKKREAEKLQRKQQEIHEGIQAGIRRSEALSKLTAEDMKVLGIK